jgi:hypothetical protein
MVMGTLQLVKYINALYVHPHLLLSLLIIREHVSLRNLNISWRYTSMKLTFNLAGAQFCDFDSKELEMVGTKCHLVHEPTNKVDPMALSVRTDEGDVHVGYIPKDGRKFKGHQALYDALLLDFEISIEIAEAVFKDNGRFNRKGRGEFTHFSVDLFMTAGEDRATYDDEDGREYMRLSRVLEQAKWEDGDGLLEWAICMFRDYKEYQTYLEGCAVEGQIIHHKAEMALWGMDLPEGVSPLPDQLVQIIKKVEKTLASEEPVFDKTISVAGTFDGLVEMDGGIRTVLDWKRSKVCQEKYKRQVSFYCKQVGAKQAYIVLARGEEPTHLTEEDINKYYKEVAGLAEFLWNKGWRK